jgi:hypothetical protein
MDEISGSFDTDTRRKFFKMADTILSSHLRAKTFQLIKKFGWLTRVENQQAGGLYRKPI